jgi:hypothetical protein
MRLPIVSTSVNSTRLRFCLSLLFLLGAICAGHAQTTATAIIANTPLGGGLFQYTITLSNTGTTGIQTFWFSWVPGQDFMATHPTTIGSPTGWTNIITGGGPSDGFAIQWKTSTNALAANAQLTFSFQSTDTPAAIAANSTFHPTTPVGTSFVYSGLPFSGTSDQFVVQPAPTITPISFMQWQLQNNVATGPIETPQNDSVPNLFKFLVGITPGQAVSAADRSELPTLGTATILGTPCLTITYRQSGLESGVIVKSQQSSDLHTWTSAPDPVELSNDPLTDDSIMQAQIPLTGTTQFVRLNVILP